MPLGNSWIRYIDRTYQQIKDRVLQDLQVLVPEMTDHTESNPYIKIIGIWAGFTEHLNYYIDNAARELFLLTSRRYSSGVKIAKLFDYRLRGVKFASADVTFTFTPAMATDKLIPSGTIVSTADGIEFITKLDSVLVAGQTEIVIPCEQKTRVAEYALGTSNGAINQEFLLTADTADKTVVIKINGVNWDFKPTLAYSSTIDKHFTTSLNLDGVTVVKFGDGVQGAVPPTGVNILVSYATSLGSKGNLAESSINVLVSDLTLPVGVECTVVNLNRASGGADIETLNNLKKNIPLSIRTLNRAVTKKDYEDIAELQAGVATAGVVFKCGKTVDVYIVPEGGGVATQSLLDEVKDAYYDETRMITTQVRVLPAGEIKVTLKLKLEVLPAFNRLAVEQEVKANLLNRINEVDRQISGALRVGNIYETVETTKGVNYCLLEQVTVLPYARIISGVNSLNWTRSLNNNSSSIIVWTIKFSSIGELELLKDGAYAGTYQIGVAVNTPEINFTVNTDTYAGGDTWQFVTYPINESVVLNEPSVCVLYENDLILTTTGGV